MEIDSRLFIAVHWYHAGYYGVSIGWHIEKVVDMVLCTVVYDVAGSSICQIGIEVVATVGTDPENRWIREVWKGSS